MKTNIDLFPTNKSPILFKTPYDCIIANPDIQLLCIGDSLTALNYGYHQVIQDNLRNLGYPNIIVNRFATSGYRIGDIYGIIDQGLDQNPNAKVFTIMLGTNDTKTSNNNQVFGKWSSSAYYFWMIHKIKERIPDAVIRIVQIPWISPNTTDGTFLPAATWEVNKDKVNKVIMGMARLFGMPTPPDMYAITKDHPEYFNIDGLHFSLAGYRNIASIFMNLLTQQPTYTADENFLTGKTYTISGGVIASQYLDDGYKLTKGEFAKIKVTGPYSDGKGIGFNRDVNGGVGATINVNVDFYFGEEVTLNDVRFIVNSAGCNYSPDSVSIYSFDGSSYSLQGTMTSVTEGYILGTQLEWWNMFIPDIPFKTKGLRLTYTKTFPSNSDWLFIREIAATRLNGYT